MPERHRKVTTTKPSPISACRAPLIGVLTARGITQPFPIQIESLPDTLAGRDVLGRGKTGSGKTLAFSIPLVSRLARQQAAPVTAVGFGAGTHP